MTLLIAYLLIHHEHLGSFWYIGATAVWVAHGYVHSQEVRFDRIDRTLKLLHSFALNNRCHYSGCTAVCKAPKR